MKKYWKIWLVIFVFSVLFVFSGFLFYLLFGSPFVNWNNNKLENAIENISAETVTLEEVVPFEWDVVYLFSPYTSHEAIAETIGFESSEIKETVSEFMTQLIFVKDEKIVSSICKYPDNAGFYIDLWGVRRGKLLDGGYAYAKYGDNVLFTVEQKEQYRCLDVAERGTTETFVSDDLNVQVSMVKDIRTENFADEMGYEWNCVVFTCYPGAKLAVVDAGEYENGQAQWAIELVNEEKEYTWEESRIRLYDDMQPVFLTDEMQGIFHLESMMYVLKFEYV